MAEDKAYAYEILRAIRRIVRRLSEHSRQIARETGLTLPQVLTLKALAELGDDDVTLGRLSEAVQLSPATMSGIVDRLVRANLLSRERGVSDRRRVCLSLTDEGKARLAELPTPLQDRFVQRLMALEGGETERLLDALYRIVELMEADQSNASPVLIAEPPEEA